MEAFTTALSSGITNFGTVWTEVMSMIVGNAALMIFLVAGLLGSAFRIFKRAKKAVR